MGPRIFISPLGVLIRTEETLLRTHFGGEYNTYRRRTSRLIPVFY